MSGRRAIAEEIAQEALLAAFRRWSRVSGLDRPDLWVRRAAFNRAISVHRRVLAETAALARVSRWSHPQQVAPPIEPLDGEVWQAVRALPRRQAAALVLSMEGHTAGEIAEALSCGEETARTHLRRARAAVATRLGDEDR